MVPIARTHDPRALERWTFALHAMEIPFVLIPGDDDGDETVVWVRPEHAPAAHEAVVELDLEAAEEAARPAPDPGRLEPVTPDALPWSLGFVAGLVVTSWLGFEGDGWAGRGILDEAAVRGGEAWRLVTAVTLHSDVRHLLSNSIMLVVLGVPAIGRAGPGLTLAAAVACGSLANVVSVALHGPGFRALGASGAVFSLLGLIAAAAVRTSPARGARRWLPGLGAAVGLFAWLGVAPGTDVIAHFAGGALGFLAGLALRLPERASYAADHPRQRLAGGVAVAVVALAWALAWAA